MTMNTEQILIRITGQDRPGLTAAVMGILARHNALVLDIGQADIHLDPFAWHPHPYRRDGIGPGHERTPL